MALTAAVKPPELHVSGNMVDMTANQAARWLRLAGVRLSSQSPHPTDRRDTLASDDAYAARADELLRRRNPPAPTGGGEGHGSPRDRARKARRATDRHVQILDVSPVA